MQLTIASKTSGGAKRKHVVVSIKNNLELLKKIESGISVAQGCKEYGVKKQEQTYRLCS